MSELRPVNADDAILGRIRVQVGASFIYKRAVWIGLIVGALAVVRMLPATLAYEEPYEFWDRVPTMDPLRYIVEPWAGYLQVFARASFVIAHPFGNDIGPLITRLLSAAVIGALATFITADVSASAIPSRRVRIALALSLPLLPIPYPGPYVGPLNAQWWIALLLLMVAFAPARPWHYLLIAVAGLTGIAPCLALPVFRDRRAISLLIPSAIQSGILFTQLRRPQGVGISHEFVLVALLLIVAMAFAPLPLRTRLAYSYLGLAVIALGSIAVGGEPGNWRYLAVASAGISLGAASIIILGVSARSAAG